MAPSIVHQLKDHIDEHLLLCQNRFVSFQLLKNTTVLYRMVLNVQKEDIYPAGL